MARERAIANQLTRLFAATSRPIYAVDDRRRIVYCNAACAQWLGVAVEELVDLRCDYHAGDSGNRLEDVAACLCPPPEAFGGTALHAIVNCPTVGSISRRLAEFLPLNGTDSEQAGVLVLVEAGELQVGQESELIEHEPEAAALHRRLQEFTAELRAPYHIDRLVGESLEIRRVREQVSLAIDAHANVQIVGPAGSGREHVARTIHCGSDAAAAGPLMPLSCGLLDAELLQTTVVAFLQRVRDTDCQPAATLLLLDVDELGLEAQAELVAFFRVPTFPLRTIVTSRQPLLELSKQDLFLEELAFRLSSFVIELPRLADRKEDIPFLCQRLLEDFNARGGRQLSGFTASTLDQLCAMPWNGNVAELADVVRESCENAEGTQVTEADLARRVRLVESAAEVPRREEESVDLQAFLEEVERELLTRSLAQAKGNKAQAARMLGISRARLLRRVSQLGLDA
jgi:DNA-binding NtrC family response regulator